jgi:hypothetical protein
MLSAGMLASVEALGPTSASSPGSNINSTSNTNSPAQDDVRGGTGVGSSSSSSSPGQENQQSIAMEIYSYLPPMSEACRLAEVYLEAGKYAYCAMPRTELFDDVLAVVYPTFGRYVSLLSALCPILFSLLFLVLGAVRSI